ncbi:hypothetical protein QFZ53_002536 [Microbacterium natoriense]|uniref:Uncharacterized protein n=1 Tax=Microbacterium natoriense TaxID=284570 RepID=A0AAW8EY18_9MICO|nr:hypothetical protein [Microbacterium natoriense]
MRRRSCDSRRWRYSPPSSFSGTLPFSMGWDVAIAELPGRGEQSGGGELQERPQLGEAVLHRRAGDGIGHVGAERGDRPMQLRLRVLDELRLVEDEPRPLDRSELLLVETRHGVRAHHDVGRCRGIRESPGPLATGALDEHDPQAGREPGRFRAPSAEHRGRRQHEERPLLPRLTRVLHEAEQLQRLAETHVVSEDAAEPMPPQEREPVEAGLLIRPQVRVQSSWQRGRRNTRRLAQPVCHRAPAHRRFRLVGEVFELLPEICLVAADARACLPLVELARLVDQLTETVESRMREREVAAVDEQQLLLALAQRREQGAEGDVAAVDRDDDSEVEPVGVGGLEGGDLDLRVAGELAVLLACPGGLDDHAHRLEGGDDVRDEGSGVDVVERSGCSEPRGAVILPDRLELRTLRRFRIRVAYCGSRPFEGDGPEAPVAPPEGVADHVSAFEGDRELRPGCGDVGKLDRAVSAHRHAPREQRIRIGHEGLLIGGGHSDRLSRREQGVHGRRQGMLDEGDLHRAPAQGRRVDAAVARPDEPPAPARPDRRS